MEHSHGKKRTILLYNKFWNYDFPDFSSLNIPDFEVLTEKEYKYKALAGRADVDVVVFYVPSLDLNVKQLLSLKRKGQIWVYWSIECNDHFADFKDPEVQGLFDIKYTYEMDADISTPYILYMPDEWRQKPVVKTEFVNGFFSSSWDKSGRYDFLSQLMSHLDIHSFGKVLNNRTLEQDPYVANGQVDTKSLDYKKEVIAKYKFSLAFENAVGKDYVTEKFFHPLQVGSVPVYLGAPNVEDFAPGDKCYIDVKSFSSVKQLADYLLLLNSNDELYNEYMKWKELPFRESFQNKLNLQRTDPFESLLELLRQRFRTPDILNEKIRRGN